MLLMLAALPAMMFARNLPLYRPAATPAPRPDAETAATTSISVLIPARNEAAGIEATLQCLLANAFQPMEILVLDDCSTDDTAAIVQRLAEKESRLRLLSSAALPAGWNGKQHACWQLAQAAKYEVLVFLDADVRVSDDFLARIAAELAAKPRDLLSGFPMQSHRYAFRKTPDPMMHLVLLGFLPLDQMRSSRKPEFGAGCGQLFIARRDAYFAAGGHRAIQASRHDGIKLPRAFRTAGFDSDLLDATDIARCRMYTSMKQVVQGLLKNANEGIAQPKLIVVFSILLLGGQTLPLFMLAHAIFWKWNAIAISILAVASIVSFLPRALAAARFRQPWIGVLLNPIAVALFIALQWCPSSAAARPQTIPWRGRS